MRFPKGRVSKLSSRIKSAVKSSGTTPELRLKELFDERGLEYLQNNFSLPGKPDFILPNQKIAIFCDGDFWHGRKWKERRKKGFKVRAEYWIAKIEGNIARDRRVSRKLRSNGWSVLRFWEHDIKRRPHIIIGKIEKCISDHL